MVSKPSLACLINSVPYLGKWIASEPDLRCLDLDGSIRKVQDEFPVDPREARLFY